MARKDSKVREHILVTTVAMIAESGTDKVHVADVARRASVGIPTIYYHFDSRAKLIGEAQSVRYEQTIRPVRELMDEVESALADEDEKGFWDAVDRYVALVWTPSQVHGKYEVGTLLLDDSLDPDVRDVLFGAMNRQYRRWVDVVVDAPAAGSETVSTSDASTGRSLALARVSTPVASTHPRSASSRRARQPSALVRGAHHPRA